MKMMSWLLFAFGCLQMYDMGASVVAEDYGSAVIDGLGGGLVMFSALVLYGQEGSE